MDTVTAHVGCTPHSQLSSRLSQEAELRTKSHLNLDETGARSEGTCTRSPQNSHGCRRRRPPLRRSSDSDPARSMLEAETGDVSCGRQTHGSDPSVGFLEIAVLPLGFHPNLPRHRSKGSVAEPPARWELLSWGDGEHLVPPQVLPLQADLPLSQVRAQPPHFCDKEW